MPHKPVQTAAAQPSAFSLGVPLSDQVRGSTLWPRAMKVAKAAGAIASLLDEESLTWIQRQHFSDDSEPATPSARIKAEQGRVRFHHQLQAWQQSSDACSDLLTKILISWNDQRDQIHPTDFWRDKALEDSRALLAAYRLTVRDNSDRHPMKVLELLYVHDLGPLVWAWEILLKENPPRIDPADQFFDQGEEYRDERDVPPVKWLHGKGSVSAAHQEAFIPSLSSVSAHRLLGIAGYHQDIRSSGHRPLLAAALLGRWPAKIQLPAYPIWPKTLPGGYDNGIAMLDVLLLLTPSLGTSIPLRREWPRVHETTGVSPVEASRQLFLLMTGCTLAQEQSSTRYLSVVADGLSDLVATLLDAGADPYAPFTLLRDTDPDARRGQRSLLYQSEMEASMTAQETCAEELSLSLPLGGPAWVPLADRELWLSLFAPIWRKGAPTLDALGNDHSRSTTQIAGFLSQARDWDNRDIIHEWHRASQLDPLLPKYPTRTQRRVWDRRWSKHVSLLLDGVLSPEKPWWLSHLPQPVLPWSSSGQLGIDEGAPDQGPDCEGEASRLPPDPPAPRHPWAQAVDGVMSECSLDSATLLGQHLLSRLPAGVFCPAEAFRYAVAGRLVASTDDNHHSSSRVSRQETRSMAFLEKCLERVDPVCRSPWRTWMNQVLEAQRELSTPGSGPGSGLKDKVRLLWTVFPEKPFAPSRPRAL